MLATSFLQFAQQSNTNKTSVCGSVVQHDCWRWWPRATAKVLEELVGFLEGGFAVCFRVVDVDALTPIQIVRANWHARLDARALGDGLFDRRARQGLSHRARRLRGRRARRLRGRRARQGLSRRARRLRGRCARRFRGRRFRRLVRGRRR